MVIYLYLKKDPLEELILQLVLITEVLEIQQQSLFKVNLIVMKMKPNSEISCLFVN